MKRYKTTRRTQKHPRRLVKGQRSYHGPSGLQVFSVPAPPESYGIDAGDHGIFEPIWQTQPTVVVSGEIDIEYVLDPPGKIVARQTWDELLESKGMTHEQAIEDIRESLKSTGAGRS